MCFLVHRVIRVHITNFASGVSLFVLLVGIGVVVIAGGCGGLPLLVWLRSCYGQAC